MNIALWTVAGLLTATFASAGLMKVSQPKDNLKEGMAWVEDFSPQTVKVIGTVELLGAIGLILPAAFDVVPLLTPIAATGLGLTMVGAAFTHLRRGEPQVVAVNAILFAMAAFVAWSRFGPQSF